MALTGNYLLTGAASGIGAATAKKISGPNCHLILQTGSNLAGLTEIARICEAKGSQVQTFVADLTDIEQTLNLIRLTQASCKELQGIVSAAGFPDWRNFESLPQTEFMKSVNLIQQTNFSLLQQLTPNLARAQGSFIGISSFLAHRMRVGDSINPASASAKAGLEALIKSYAAQYAEQGIRCNAIVPGYIKKDGANHPPTNPDVLNRIESRIPAKRLGLPEEVASLAQFLLSDKSQYITGQSIHIDGGLLLV